MSCNKIFPKGEPMVSNFTGKAFVNLLVPDTNGIYNCRAYEVLFEAGCRNDWHTRAGGQLLLRAGGTGYYQEKRKVARRLQRGDVVEILPNIERRHGTAPDSEFTRIGISPNTQKGTAIWISPVTDEEYYEATGGRANV